MGERKFDWSSEFQLSTMDIVMAVVFGVASVAMNTFLGYMDRFSFTLGPFGQVALGMYTGLRWTTQMVPAHLRKKGFLFFLAQAVTYVLRGFILGYEIQFIFYIAMGLVPMVFLHYGKYTDRSFIVATAIMGLINGTGNVLMYGGYLAPTIFWVATILVTIVSDALFTGGLGVLIGKRLVNAGLAEEVQL